MVRLHESEGGQSIQLENYGGIELGQSNQLEKYGGIGDNKSTTEKLGLRMKVSARVRPR